MCGIFGEWSRRERVCEPDPLLTGLTELMHRRGPDDSGTWSDGRRCRFGFRRLSILDLSPSGHQPMSTPDRRYTLVFNGEVYNFRELRGELEGRGIRFRSTGDAEVVLQSLACWGRDALARFNGMFALACYDAQRESLLLARDHAGIKPLYYALSGEGLVFASQYDQLLKHPWLSARRPSSAGLGFYLRLGYIPAPYALLDDTHTLPAGGWLEADPVRGIERGAHFEFPRSPEATLRGEEACEAVDSAVTNAVGRCLVSDVPVGCFLSGGIDSPLVAACIRDQHGSVPSFTIGTAGDAHDESSDALRYARELGHTPHVEHLRSAGSLELLEDVVAACSEPLADPSIFPTLLVSRLASRHVKVVLSGDGGDELFWGYVGRYLAVLDQAERCRRSPLLRRMRWLAASALKRDAREFWPTLGDWYRYKYAKFRPPWIDRLFPTLPDWPRDYDKFDSGARDADSAAEWARWNSYNVGLQMILLKVDRASMFHSLEVRVPLLDREVVETAAKVDWRSCLDRREKLGKLPLRRALQRRTTFQTSAKRGFSIAMDDWLRGELRELMHDMVLSRTDFLGLPFDRDAAARMYHEHTSGSANHATSLWILLNLALWIERHVPGRHFPVAPAQLAPGLATAGNGAEGTTREAEIPVCGPPSVKNPS